MVTLWRIIKGAEPDAIKVASPVLNAGNEETCLEGNAPCSYATGIWRLLTGIHPRLYHISRGCIYWLCRSICWACFHAVCLPTRTDRTASGI